MSTSTPGTGLRATLIKLGIFTAVALAVSALIIGTLMDGVPGDKTSYRAEFTDASNVQAGDPVRVAGVKVGTVTGVELEGEGGLAIVTFEVSNDQPVTAATEAVLRFENLLGQRYLALAEGSDTQGDAPRLEAGTTIPLSRTTPALDLTAVFNGFRPLFEAIKPEEVNQLATEIIATLQGEGPTISSLLEHTASLTSRLADRDEVLGTVIENLSAVMTTATDHKGDIRTLVDGLDTITGALAEDGQSLDQMLVSVSRLTASTRGFLDDTAGLATADIRRLARLTRLWSDHRGELEQALQQYPRLLKAVTRAQGYGAWTNVYLCDLSVKAGPAPIVDVGVPGRRSWRC